MSEIQKFTFNDFQVNTYLIYDDNHECIIIDPGCFSGDEQHELVEFIDKKQLKPVRLINTHSHIDHILGNDFIRRKYGLYPEAHQGAQVFYDQAGEYAMMFGVDITHVPHPREYIKEGQEIQFGNTAFQAIHTPGHAEGSICLINNQEKYVIVGDVLFNGGIGRTDLPTGDYQILISNVEEKLFTLDDDFIVYPGHGPDTTIGDEKRSNPFFQGAVND
ncbi:MAG: MBL fold metallo-hydrolase [Bacteroidales bacterium]|nr:MBL fold metallo-hydrolase [Bacteroidales bacterium]